MTQVSNSQHLIHDVKKLKKDGSIPSNCVESIVRSLKSGELIIMPIDSVYGIIGLRRDDIIDEIINITAEPVDSIEIVISNFKMLEEMALVDKFVYNFLKRVWPGEVIVQLKNRECAAVSNLFMRMPRHKYILDIVNGVGMPIVYMPARSSVRKMIFNDKDIMKRFKDICSILIISEFNKNHSLPTLIDVSCDKLNIINEGRVSAEEIKSLYFLGDL
ncbi:MAG TPA: Sua5/YciO/YrdC/YwlC family protein [Spirochaetota bacterium]|nr:Sua5/YciO/YrdC/YwlC family protein [Spirochaetota bacterium]